MLIVISFFHLPLATFSCRRLRFVLDPVRVNLKLFQKDLFMQRLTILLSKFFFFSFFVINNDLIVRTIFYDAFLWRDEMHAGVSVY